MQIVVALSFRLQYNGTSQTDRGWSAIQNRLTLFEHVYQNLKDQIMTGRLARGDRLPSMSRLCEFYHVGIRTVKDVLRTLKEEGYISTEERRPAVVIYIPPEPGCGDPALRSVLEREGCIRQAYRAAAVLVPLLLAFSAQFCSAEDLHQLSRDIARLNGKGPEARGRVYTARLCTLLERPRNLLFRDLFASLELHTNMPYFRNQARFLELMAQHDSFGGAAWAMEALATQDQKEIIARFRGMLESVASAVDAYLEELLRKYGAAERAGAGEFTWAAERGRDFYYMRIARDLIDKITMGVYPEGTFLPPEAQLARQYGVCVTTVRKAVAMLDGLGFGRTYNAKGTKVFLQSDDSAIQSMKSRAYRQDTMRYLSGLQLMAIAIKPAARMAIEGIDAAELRRLEAAVGAPGSLPLELMVQCVISRQPLQPLRVILREVCALMRWGYYFAFFSGGPAGADTLRELSLSAFSRLRCGDAEGFADGLSGCFCHILTFVRGNMTALGLPEAEGIATPDCRWY